MRFQKTYASGGQGWIVTGLVALTVSLVALAGGAATGHAAASPGVVATFTVLNDDSPTLPGAPTPGKNIGYEVTVTNKGTSIAKHLSLRESIGGAIDPSTTSTEPVYQSATGITCDSSGGLTVTCALDTLDVNASFHVVLLYKTDPAAVPGSATIPGSSFVTNDTVVAFDSQTNGTNNQKTLQFDATRYFADASLGLAETVSQGNGEQLSAGGTGQTSVVTMPQTFVNGFPFVTAKVQNRSAAALCSKCPRVDTQITIPASSPFATTGPFYAGPSIQSPFTWSLTLPGSQVPNGFKLTGVYHDGTLVLPCADPSAPLIGTGICVSSLVQDSSTKTITAFGPAFTNGSYQFG
jgi:hypothetical protein